MKQPGAILVIMLCVAAVALGASGGKSVKVTGYVLDSACAFTKGLDKPISADCARTCAKAGAGALYCCANWSIRLASLSRFCSEKSVWKLRSISAWTVFSMTGDRKSAWVAG